MFIPKDHIKLYEEFYSQKLNLQYLQFISAGPSTFRAFRKNIAYKTSSPSKIFKDWMSNYIENLNTKGSFKKMHNDAVLSLSKYWIQEAKIDLIKSQPHLIYKLVDLFFKHAPLYMHMSAKVADFIKKECYPALDSLVYYWLKIDNNVSFGKYKLSSMGDWPKDKYTYKEWHNYCQKEIKKLCLSKPPIIYDLYAWNVGRDKMEVA